MAQSAAGSGDQEDSQSSTTNFEINKTVSTIAEPVGALVRQSVAVVVDNSIRASEPADDDASAAPQPRSEEEMQKITDLVRAAVGIDEARGDVLIVENIPFDEAATPSFEPTAQGIDWVNVVIQVARYGALPVAVLPAKSVATTQ